jgi:L-seryl-tRNA(Ser) seleniumtransferase
MKVHPSNYRVIGFASSVPSRDLVDLAHSNGLPFVHDLGSGLLRRRIGGVEPVWLKDEPSVADSLAEGADLVTFSGDKLLAGPQAGIICGTAAAIDKLKNQPLLRALRVDKLTLAALDATLSLYVAGEEATLPFWSMALLDEGEIAARASRIMDELKEQHAKVAVIEGHSTTGGGSSPTSEIPTALLEISPLETSAQALHRSLVALPLPIVGRIDEDRLLLDLRTVDPSDDDAVASGLKSVL